MATEADAKGRLGFEEREYPQHEYMLEAATVLRSLKYSDLALVYKGDKLINAIRARKTNAMKVFKQQWNNGRD